MLDAVLRQRLFEVMFLRSHFKKAQLDALLSKRSGQKSNLGARYSVSLRDKPVTLGSSERSAEQAELVIAKSIATLILAMSLGLVSPKAVDSIPRIAALMEQSTLRELSDDEQERFKELVGAFLRQSSHQ